jgi:hypothetical protein
MKKGLRPDQIWFSGLRFEIHSEELRPYEEGMAEKHEMRR